MIKASLNIKVNDIEGIYAECNLSDSSLFIDLGANIGQQVGYLLDKNVRTIAFEPHPIIFAKLIDKYMPNNNLECYKVAAWVCDEKRNLFFKHGPDEINGGSSLIYEKTNIEHDRAFTVDCIDFSRFLFNLDKNVDVLKVDIEGSEYHLISHLMTTGAISFVKNIFVEDHERKIAKGTKFYQDYIEKRNSVLDFFLTSNINYYGWK